MGRHLAASMALAVGWALACGFGEEAPVDAPEVEPIEEVPVEEPPEVEVPDEPEPVDELPDWENEPTHLPSEHEADEADEGCAVRAFLHPSKKQVLLRDAPSGRSQPMGKLLPPVPTAHLAITGRKGDFFEVSEIDGDLTVVGRPSGWIDASAAGILPEGCARPSGDTWSPRVLTEPELGAETEAILLDQPLHLLECEGSWWRVYAPRQGVVGWISDEQVCDDPDRPCMGRCEQWVEHYPADE